MSKAPPRDRDVDVSGKDGVRFVVITSTSSHLAWFPTAGLRRQARAAWQPFDTATKRLAGRPHYKYEEACRQAELLNLADEVEEIEAA